MLKYLKHNTDLLFCFLLLFSSGNPIFIYSPAVRELYVGLSVLAVFLAAKRNVGLAEHFFKYSAIFIFTFLLQFAFYANYSISSSIFSVLRILIGISIFLCLKDNFVTVYVESMTIVALISLILFTYNCFFGLIPGIETTETRTSLIIYTQIFSRYTGILLRNSGMFWEPGAFQGYLNLAISFVLLTPDYKRKKLQLLILVIAVLTTTSTTGYLALGFIILFYMMFIGRFSTFERIVAVIFTITVILYSFFTFDFLNDKISETIKDTESSQSRITDFIRYKDDIIDSIFVGNYSTKELGFDSGNGLVYLIIYYSGIISIYYFIMLWRKLRKQTNKRVAQMLCCVVFLTLLGENFAFYPLYIALPLIKLNFTYRNFIYSNDSYQCNTKLSQL